LAFTLHFSAFTTQALMIESNKTPRELGALTAEILRVLLNRAVELQRSAAIGGDSITDASAATGED